MLLGNILFVAFAVLSVIGAYWAVSVHRGRRVAIVAALATAAGYVALSAGMIYFLRGLGGVP
jgi:hypothetical protein